MQTSLSPEHPLHAPSPIATTHVEDKSSFFRGNPLKHDASILVKVAGKTTSPNLERPSQPSEPNVVMFVRDRSSFDTLCSLSAGVASSVKPARNTNVSFFARAIDMGYGPYGMGDFARAIGRGGTH
jgi:hypothetical protein